MYFDVNTVASVVLRKVDIFADGRIERNSIALELKLGGNDGSTTLTQ